MKRYALTFLATIVFMISTASPAYNAKAVKLSPKLYAKKLTLGLWDRQEWVCLKDLWHRESRWNHKANNPKSTAYGIPQILGMDEKTPALRQVELGLEYIIHRYNTPCQALSFHKRNGWY